MEISDKTRIKNMIIESAKIYDQFLVRKDFLYVYGENYFEVSFPVDHFRHLTGVNSCLYAKKFYNYAKNGVLTNNQFYFDEHYLMNLAFIKLTYLYLDDFEYVDIELRLMLLMKHLMKELYIFLII